MATTSQRPDQRENSALRSIRITPAVNPYAEGSVMVEFGRTQLLITATVEKEVPKWMGDNPTGWVTAEYGMLPRSTHTRNKREAASGKQGGRTLEIQRLIGRALRAAVNLRDIAPLTVKLDCDVIVADGGTRTAAITGGWVALRHALDWAFESKVLSEKPAVHQIAAVSVGVIDGTPRLDLCYEEDSNADFDLNLVFNEKLELIEIQGTAEKGAIDVNTLSALLQLGQSGAQEIFQKQKEALKVRRLSF